MVKNLHKYLREELLDVQRTLGWMDLVISSIDDAVCVTDAEYKIIFANDYFATLVDVPRVFLLGREMREVINLRRVKNPLVEYRDIKNKFAGVKNASSGIYEWKVKRGLTLTFRVAVRLLPNSDQRVFLIQNVSEEYELTNMKNNFVSLASHQLRTPLTAIQAYSNILGDGMMGPLTPDQQKITDTILLSVQRMNNLVNGLLKITRLQSGQTKFKKQVVHMPDLLKQIFTELKPRFTENNLRYSIEISTEFPTIFSEKSSLHEIFSNLITNAVQYTPDSGTVTVRGDHTTDSIIIAITDTGIGIPKSHQASLFEQFSRADNALAAYTEGTGLGLYLVKVLLERIGGSIDFKSKLNVGTTFIVTLPL